MYSKMKHAKFKLPTPAVHAKHPLRNVGNHDTLLEYLLERMRLGKDARDARLGRLGRIDREVSGWIVRTSDDEIERETAKAQNGTPVALESNLPIAFIHLDDMMTYFAQTFAPNRGMFYQLAKPDEQEIASQLVSLMNYHAVYSGYYRQLLLSLWSILKYNYGGVTLEWATEYGPKLVTDGLGNTQVESVQTFSGNRIEALDLYNTFWDPTVHPVNVHKDGEWAAKARRRSLYWLKSKCMDNLYYNCADMLEAGDDEFGAPGSYATYYINPPQEARLSSRLSSGGRDDWMSILGESWVMDEGQFELVDITIRINPNDFGLVDGDAAARAARNQYEIWRFTILNGERIIACVHLNNVHRHIPFYFGVINDDTSGEESKSPAEVIQPLADFASFLMNIHVKACRKNVWGTTYYDPSVVDYSGVPPGEVAARVPIKAQGYGKDIRQYVYHDSKVLDTKQTLQDMQGVMTIIDQFFPTQSMPSQIAGIDRAISSQVAAVQQGSNRRQHKAARLMDDTYMRPMRAGMYYNIVQYQEDGVEVPNFYGPPVKVDLANLRNTNLSTVIGQGLMAIDRQAAMEMVQQVIFALIQNPRASQQADIMKMLDYWVGLMDIEMNLAQFTLSAEQIAAQQGVAPAGQGSGVEPATNPGAVTEPIYG